MNRSWCALPTSRPTGVQKRIARQRSPPPSPPPTTCSTHTQLSLLLLQDDAGLQRWEMKTILNTAQWRLAACLNHSIPPVNDETMGAEQYWNKLNQIMQSLQHFKMKESSSCLSTRCQDCWFPDVSRAYYCRFRCWSCQLRTTPSSGTTWRLWCRSARPRWRGQVSMMGSGAACRNQSFTGCSEFLTWRS